jgi:TRAP-type C4-dicarboxylate transport system permease small subunit
MPSMHVAMPVLYALVARRTSRALALFFGLYGLAIWLATTHLGWHYAVDGYVGALAMLGVWCISGRIVRRQHRGRGSAAGA